MRYLFLVDQFREEMDNSRILDLAAHDGRWSYALAGTGAREVVGIEIRGELIERFADMPQDAASAKVMLRQGDIFKEIHKLINEGQTFDVVAVYGIFYHIMDHFLLIKLITSLRPKLIIIDSEFISVPNPMIQLVRERTDNPLNAAEQRAGQEIAIAGVPSIGAMEAMADVLDYTCEWSNWDQVPVTARIGLSDYYRDAKKRRRTCVLRPKRSHKM